jgi:toxin ParE1/3/4
VRVELTAKARRDLFAIHSYIGAETFTAAETWFEGLQDAILGLDQLSARGTVTPEDSRFRQILFGRKPHTYRIIYRIEAKDTTVRIMQIRHGARDRFQTRKTTS